MGGAAPRAPGARRRAKRWSRSRDSPREHTEVTQVLRERPPSWDGEPPEAPGRAKRPDEDPPEPPTPPDRLF